jgi:hypothetical protein
LAVSGIVTSQELLSPCRMRPARAAIRFTGEMSGSLSNPDRPQAGNCPTSDALGLSEA